MNFATFYDDGYTYNEFLDKYAQPGDRQRWDAVHQRIQLSDPQRELLGGFRRHMKVLVMAGAWCGDCVEQCPIFDHFAAASERIGLRFVDRDDCGALNEELVVCGAPRVPQIVFLSEDDHPVARAGDRTLSKYRAMVAGLDGRPADRPSGDGLLAATVQDWLNEFERVQWILRTSGRLRKLHGD